MMKIRNLYLFVLIVLFVVLLSSSCTMKIVKASKSKNELKLLIEKISKYNEGIKSFKGSGYAILKDGKTTKTFRIEVIFGSDFNSYKILIKDFVFQKPIAVLIKKADKSIILYDYIKREKFNYSDTSEIFKKTLNFSIPEGDIFVQSLGLKAPIFNNKSAHLLDSDSIEFNSVKSKELIRFTNEYPAEIVYTTNTGQMIIKYDKIVEVEGKHLPSKILFTIGNTSLEINYKAIEINRDYSAELKLNL